MIKVAFLDTEAKSSDNNESDQSIINIQEQGPGETKRLEFDYDGQLTTVGARGLVTANLKKMMAR